MIRVFPKKLRSRRISVRMTALLAAAVLAGSVPVPAASAEGDTPLPTVCIQTSGQIGDNYQQAVISVNDENGTADIADAACSVRLRGNSSRRSPKPSYKIHFEEKANPLQLGDGKAKTWALIGNCFDASLLRNYTAMQIAEKLSGLPYTPNCRSVELYQNGRYSGVYLLIETVSVNKHRVAITEQRDQVADNGYLLEMTCYAEEPRFYADFSLFEIKSELSQDDEIRQAQVDYIRQYTENALHALQSGDAAKAAQYIDIDSLVDNCILNEICKNADVGWDSYYLYRDAGGRLTFCPVWDFDIAFGNATIPPCFSAAEGENPFMLSDCLDDSNSWLCYALQAAWFRRLLKARWEEMLPQLQTVPDAVTEEAAAHSAAYEDNYIRLTYNIAGFMPYPDDSTRPCYTQAAQAEILADWIGKRLKWLDDFYHSPEFDAGIFPDEFGNELPLSNELAARTLSKSDSGYGDLSDLNYSGSASGGDIVCFDDLKLIGGQLYQLTFDGSCSGSADVCCLITGDDGFEEICENFSVGPDPQTIEMLFTPNQNCLHASLRISGTGSGMIRISKLSLSKQHTASGTGDLNGDGSRSLADIILLKNWLLCVPDTVLADWKAGDMDGNGRLSAADLTYLKRELIQK